MFRQATGGTPAGSRYRPGSCPSGPATYYSEILPHSPRAKLTDQTTGAAGFATNPVRHALSAGTRSQQRLAQGVLLQASREEHSVADWQVLGMIAIGLLQQDAFHNA